jgi:hypothetical protein
MKIELTLQDYIFIASTIFFGIKWLMERVKLPAKYQKLLDQIDIQNVIDIINRVQAFNQLNSSEKLNLASEELRQFAERNIGIEMSRTLSLLIVQYVYQKIKKEKK